MNEHHFTQDEIKQLIADSEAELEINSRVVELRVKYANACQRCVDMDARLLEAARNRVIAMRDSSSGFSMFKIWLEASQAEFKLYEESVALNAARHEACQELNEEFSLMDESVRVNIIARIECLRNYSEGS